MSDMSERISVRVPDGTRARLDLAMSRYRRRNNHNIDLSMAIRFAIDHLCMIEEQLAPRKEPTNGS